MARFSIEAIFKAIDKTSAPVNKMQNRIQKFTRSASRNVKRLTKSVNRMAAGFGRGLKSVLKLGTVGVASLAVGIGLLLKQFSKVENAEAAFTPILGGIKKAKEAVAALNKTAATTPFQFETLAGAMSQLLPVIKGDIPDIIKLIRMLGDTAGGNAQKLDSIVRGFTKAMLKGKVDMESLNMIAEAGVPIFDELSQVMGVSTAKMFKMITAGKVTTTQLTKAFEKMTSSGGKFFNGMEIASKTMTGMWSTLKDNVSLTAATLGEVLAPEIKGLISKMTDISRSVREWVVLNKALITSRFNDFLDKAKTKLGEFWEKIKEIDKKQDLLSVALKAITALTTAVVFLGEHGGTVLKVTAAVYGLVAAVNILNAGMIAFNLLSAMNPIVLTIAAIAGAVAFIVFAITKTIKQFGRLKNAINVFKGNPFAGAGMPKVNTPDFNGSRSPFRNNESGSAPAPQTGTTTTERSLFDFNFNNKPDNLEIKQRSGPKYDLAGAMSGATRGF